jgi:hypothetical protein
VEKGLSNANAEGFSIMILCLNISRCFLFTSSKSARGRSDSVSLAIKDV